jgi:hypothetical protein
LRRFAFSVLVAAGALAGVWSCGDLQSSPQPFSSDGSAPPEGVADVSVTPQDADADADLDAGPEPLTILSPYSEAGTMTTAEPLDWTLASIDPGAPIHYTLDGTDPVGSLQVALGRITFSSLPDGTTIRWSVGLSQTSHAFVVHVDPDAGSLETSMLDRFAFDDAGVPILKVSRDQDAAVTGTLRARAWTGAGCPTCVVVVGVGISKVDSCPLVINPPGTYVHYLAASAPIAVGVPAEAGVYPIRSTRRDEYGCDPDAGWPVSDPQIGVLIVE